MTDTKELRRLLAEAMQGNLLIRSSREVVKEIDVFLAQKETT